MKAKLTLGTLLLGLGLLVTAAGPAAAAAPVANDAPPATAGHNPDDVCVPAGYAPVGPIMLPYPHVCASEAVSDATRANAAAADVCTPDGYVPVGPIMLPYPDACASDVAP